MLNETNVQFTLLLYSLCMVEHLLCWFILSSFSFVYQQTCGPLDVETTAVSSEDGFGSWENMLGCYICHCCISCLQTPST